MNSHMQRRLMALESKNGPEAVVVILRSIAGCAPDRIVCRGRPIPDDGPQDWLRFPDETAEAFRVRAVADAKLRMAGAPWPVVCLRELSEDAI